MENNPCLNCWAHSPEEGCTSDYRCGYDEDEKGDDEDEEVMTCSQ